MSNLEKLLAAEGVENCHPTIIGPVLVEEGKPKVKQVLAKFVDNEDIHLTDYGRLFLQQLDGDKAKPAAKKPRTGKADDPDLDLD